MSSMIFASFKKSTLLFWGPRVLLSSNLRQYQWQNRNSSFWRNLQRPCDASSIFFKRVVGRNSSSSSNHHVENSLPKLPVPELQDTMKKYLAVLSTVLTPRELHVSTQHVLDFMAHGGWGNTLQAYLLKRRSETDNWAHDWWLHDMHLSARLPLVINSNPGMVDYSGCFTSQEQQLRYASKLVLGVLDFRSKLESGCLPVDMVDKGTRPLCMEQYNNLFCSYRRPGVPSDYRVKHRGVPPFFVVACRNQFYRVEVERDGERMSEGQVLSQLSKVLAAAEQHSAGSPPVGVLTTLDRSAWAQARETLAKEPGNQENLDALEKCLILLCLDKTTRGSIPSSSYSSASLSRISADKEGDVDTDDVDDEDILLEKAHYALHGGGVDANSCNRWFDKPHQVLLSEDGVVGINSEHSQSEAGPPVKFFVHFQEYCKREEEKAEGGMEEERGGVGDPVWLKWSITPHIQSIIDQALLQLDRNVKNVDVCVRYFDEYGADFPKSQGLSPDAFVQLALQLTYYRLHGRMAMSHESATLRRFRNGRVDNIRANSPAALAWIQTMCGEKQARKDEKLALFREAADWQKKYQMEAVNGYGMDCHLIGLREAARDLNVLDSIPLFSDPAFDKTFCYHLDTSHTPSLPGCVGVFGASDPDGYAVPYNINPQSFLITVSCYRDCKETDATKFCNCLHACLLEMRDFCLQE